MPTRRQQIAAEVARAVARFAPCRCIPSGTEPCGARGHKLVLREQHGVDLQCRACGRLAECKCYRVRAPKGKYSRAPELAPRRRGIPGGSYAVWQRQQQQGHRVDLFVAEYSKQGDIVVRSIRAEDQPLDMRKPRQIRSGERAGHIVTDIVLGILPQEAFPIVARSQLPHRARRIIDGGGGPA